MKASHSCQQTLVAVLLAVIAVCATSAAAQTTTTTNNNSNSILKEPCLIIARITGFTDGTDTTDLFCMLRGVDVTSHGPIDMKIDGLTEQWAIDRQAFPSATVQHTIFMENVIVDDSNFTLKLPDGMTIDDMLLAHHTDGRTDGHGHGRALDTPDMLGVGDKKVLLIQVVFQNNYTVPKSLIVDKVFNAQPNFTDQFEAMSFGKLSLSTMPTNGTDDGILTIHYPSEADPYTLRNSDVDNYVRQYLALEAKIFDDFDHFMIFMPYSTDSNQGRIWAAYAYLYRETSVYNGIKDYPNAHRGFQLDTIIHELGHNFGLHHSNRFGEEYGDRSGAMGGRNYNRFGNGTLSTLSGYNGAKSWEMGWYFDQTITLTGGQDIDFEGRLCGVVDYDPTDTSYHVIIRIDDPESAFNYYVAFNRAIGFNADSSLGRNQVLVTSARDRVPGYWERSELEAILDIAQPSYRIIEFGSAKLLHGIVISVSNIDDESATPMCATVSVKGEFSQSPSTTPSVSFAPSVSVAPSNIPSAPPSLTPTGQCGKWEYTRSRRSLFGDDDITKSFRFDLRTLGDFQITGMRLFVAPGFSNMPYTIFFRPDTWEVDGNWTQIASGNNGETDSDDYTATLPFDSPLLLPANTGTVSFRIDMANQFQISFSGSARMAPSDTFSCPFCPFDVYAGQASFEIGDSAPSFFPGFFPYFIGSLDFCYDLDTEMPTGSASPSTSVSPTTQPSIVPSQAPTTSCLSGETAGLPREFYEDEIASVRYNIEILSGIDITGMRLVLPSTGSQPYTIFYRPSTWDAPGDWTEIASGTIEARGSEEFTDVITFDRPLSVSEADGVVAIRVDTQTESLYDATEDYEPTPPDWFECEECPFIMFPGMSSEEVGEYPDAAYEGYYDFFMGSLEFCKTDSLTVLATNTPSDMASAAPSLLPSPAPSPSTSSRPSFMPSPTPSSAPSPSTSSRPSFMPSSTPSSRPSLPPSSVPSSQPTLAWSTKGAKGSKSSKESKTSKSSKSSK